MRGGLHSIHIIIAVLRIGIEGSFFKKMWTSWADLRMPRLSRAAGGLRARLEGVVMLHAAAPPYFYSQLFVSCDKRKNQLRHFAVASVHVDQI